MVFGCKSHILGSDLQTKLNNLPALLLRSRLQLSVHEQNACSEESRTAFLVIPAESPTERLSPRAGWSISGKVVKVRASIEDIEAGKFVEYAGRGGLKELADGVKARGRRLLARGTPGK
jgi:hypothetical protein